MLFIPKRAISFLTSLVILITCVSVSAKGDDVTVITTVEQLNAVRNNVDESGKIYGNYRLGANIIFSDDEYFVHIGFPDNTFIGEFDGNGYTIKNIKIKVTENDRSTLYLGLFYKNNGTIKNLIMENASLEAIKSDFLCVGLIAGQMYSSGGRGKIVNCNVEGNISLVNAPVAHYSRIGGVVGVATSGTTISDTISNVNMQYEGSSSAMIGGIVGDNSSKIFSCANKGNINVNSKQSVYAGGIAAHLSDSTSVIQDCYNTGEIEAESEMSMCLGGIAGAVGESNGMETKLLYNFNVGKITPNAKFEGGFNAGMANVASGSIIGSFKGESRDNYYLDGTYSVAASSGTINATKKTVQEIRNSGLNMSTVWYLPQDENALPQLQKWKNIKEINLHFEREMDKEYRTIDIDKVLIIKAMYDDGTTENVDKAVFTKAPTTIGEQSVVFSWRGVENEESFIGYRAGDIDFNGEVEVSDIVAGINAIVEKENLGISMVAADVDKNSKLNVTDIVSMRKRILQGN